MKLTLLLIPLILLSSCTIDWNDEKDAKIASLNTKIEELNGKIEESKKKSLEQKEEIKKVKDDEVFKKSQECWSYKKELDKKYTYIHPDGTEMNPDGSIFYSPTMKTCVYSYLDNVWTTKPAFYFIDALTSTTIDSVPFEFKEGLFLKAREENNKMYLKLKWE